MLKRVENNGMVLKTKNCANRCKYGETSGTPGQIRTADLLIRSQSLYPAELRAHQIPFSFEGVINIAEW
jgi:hypothetical protein